MGFWRVQLNDAEQWAQMSVSRGVHTAAPGAELKLAGQESALLCVPWVLLHPVTLSWEGWSASSQSWLVSAQVTRPEHFSVRLYPQGIHRHGFH